MFCVKNLFCIHPMMAQPSPDQATASPTKFEARLMSGKLWRLIWQQF